MVKNKKTQDGNVVVISVCVSKQDLILIDEAVKIKKFKSRSHFLVDCANIEIKKMIRRGLEHGFMG